MATVQEILDTALKLSEENRAKLTHELLRSLDPPGDEVSDAEWQNSWSQRAVVRSEAYERGETAAADCKDSLAHVRQQLENRETP